METIKGLIKSLINGGIGAIVGAAFATAFGWNEWILAIIGYILGWLLPSPFVIMFLLIVAGEIREAWHITNFLAVTLCAIVGLIALLFTSWVLGKLVYFIIK